MSIAQNSLITWEDLSNTVVNAIKGACCNVDAFASNVPARLKNGTATKTTTIWDFWTTVPNNVAGNASGQTSRHHIFYAINKPNSERANNLIAVVTESTVKSEWSTFLNSAGINTTSRTGKIIQAKELGLAIGLFQQFLSYHVKPVHSRGQIFSQAKTNPQTQSEFRGMKYITGTCTPKYQLTPIEPTSVPVVQPSDITNLVNQDVDNNMIAFYNSATPHLAYVSTSSNG